MATEAVADGNPVFGCPGSAEFRVVADQINRGLRPHEEVALGIKLQPAAKIAEEMRDAGEISARDKVAIQLTGVKTVADCANAGPELRRGFGYGWRPEGVNVIQDRPKRHYPLIIVAGSPPGDVAAYTQVFPQFEVGAEAGEYASTHRLRREVAAGVVR